MATNPWSAATVLSEETLSDDGETRLIRAPLRAPNREQTLHSLESESTLGPVFLTCPLCHCPLFSRVSTLTRFPMTQHNSFKATGGSGKKNRTVLKRFERVDLLKKRGQWKEGDRVIGLKKTLPEA